MMVATVPPAELRPHRALQGPTLQSGAQGVSPGRHEEGILGHMKGCPHLSPVERGLGSQSCPPRQRGVVGALVRLAGGARLGAVGTGGMAAPTPGLQAPTCLPRSAALARDCSGLGFLLSHALKPPRLRVSFSPTKPVFVLL